MTEKRFVMEDLEILCRILDNGKVINGIEIVNLLNALYEENEQLKKENQELRKYLSWQDMELEEMEDLND